MRHNKQKRPSFGRQNGPRKALIRGLVYSLVEHERIKTTLSKAKYTRPLIEKAITMGKRGDVHSRRLLFSRYPNKKTVDKIMEVLSPRFHAYPGGYTRIIKLGFRAGDQAPLAYIEFVDYNSDKVAESSITELPKTTKSPQLTKKPKPDKELLTDKKTKASAPLPSEDKKTAKQDSKKTAKKAHKKGATDKKPLTAKKQKKQLLIQADRKRKKSRLIQKKSRKANRP